MMAKFSQSPTNSIISQHVYGYVEKGHAGRHFRALFRIAVIILVLSTITILVMMSVYRELQMREDIQRQYQIAAEDESQEEEKTHEQKAEEVTYITQWFSHLDIQEMDLLGERLNVVISKNISSRQLGLSGTEVMPDDYGMLFIFDSVGEHGIWMKGMNYSIDIFWLDESFNLVHEERNVSPGTYPTVFGEGIKSRYVLETAVGTIPETSGE